MVRHTCPPADRWHALLDDRLPPAEQADLNGHLELCPACQRTLETCAAQPDAWASTARSLGHPGPTRDQALRDVIDRLKLDPDADRDDGAELPLDFLDPPDHPGTLGRIGPYQVLGEVGRGGMGVVLKALDPGLHRVVAIKVLAPQLAVSGTARKRFTREARAAAAVQHDNVVTIHAVEEFKGLPYLVMQYVAGPSVQQRLADDGGPLPVAEVLRIGAQTAAGLAAAHAQGLVHRDVKPANILLENGVERVKLTDFSLARAIDDASVTRSGVVTGTPPYMAPEQARGEPLDHRADLFSLGSVLYALCTGRPPFRGSNPLDVLRKVSEETPVSIRTLNPEVPSWLEAVVTKLMAKDPAERFQSAGEVAALLERCLAHVQQPTAVPLPAIPGVAPPRRGRRWPVALPLLAGLVVVAAVTVLRIKTDNGTLVLTIDDPAAVVQVDGADVTVSGIQGVKEVRLKSGDYTVHQTRDGKPEKTDVVTIKRGEATPLKVTFEPDARAAAGTATGFLNELFGGRVEAERQQAEAAQRQAEAARRAVRAAELEKKIADLEMQKRRLLSTMGPNHPAVKEIDAEIALIQGIQGAVATRTDGTRVTQPRRSFPTAAGEVSSAVFSPDGKELFVADWNGTVHAHDFATGRVRFTVTGAGRFLAVSPDGKFLVGVGANSSIQFVDLRNGKVRQSLAGGPAPYYAVAFSADGKTLAAGGCGPDGRGGLLELWDLESGKVRTVEFADPVQALAVPPGREDRLAVGTGGEGVRMVYPSEAQEKYSLRQPGPIRALAFSPDGKMMAASSGEGRVYLWDWQWGREAAMHQGKGVLTGHTGRVTSLQFSPDGRRLLTAGLDGTARLWDNLWNRSPHDRPAATFAPGTYKTGMGVAVFTPDGKSVVTAGDDGQVRVWDVPTVGAEKPGAGAGAVPAAPPAGQPRATATEGARVTQPQRAIRTANGGVTAAAFSPDGKRLYVADSVGDVYGYDFAAGTVEFKVAAQDRIVAVSPDGAIVAAVGTGQGVQLYDAKTGRLEHHFAGQPKPYHAVLFLPDGKTLAAGGYSPDSRGGLLELWDLSTGRARTVQFAAAVLSLAVPPGREDRLAVGTDGADVHMVYPSTGTVGYSLKQPGPVAALAFSPDGRWLAAAGGDRVHLWDWQGGRDAAMHRGTDVLAGHAGPVTAAQFSPDGTRLVTAGADGAAKVWDMTAAGFPRRCVATFAPADRTGTAVALFSPDGRAVITAGEDHNIRVWDLASLASGRAEPVPGSAHPPLTVGFTDGTTIAPDGSLKVNTGQCLACHGGGVPVDHGRRKPWCVTDAKPGEKRARFEFRDKPWAQVLDWLSDTAGLPVTAATKPTGTFTFSPPNGSAGDKDGYTLTETIDILNDALLGQKFLLVRRERSLTLVLVDEPVEPSLVPRVRPDELAGRGRTELVSTVCAVKYVRAADVAADVKKLLGPFGQVAADARTNRLVLQDTAGNLRAVLTTLAEIDKPAAAQPGR